MSDDLWASLAGQFVDEAYASVKGYVRTYVLHQQLLAHLPDPSVPQRQFPLDAIERIYCSFANTLAAMRLNTTCTCNACEEFFGDPSQDPGEATP